jgi:hypothetical protein
MRKPIILTFVAALCLVAATSWAAPFGHLDGLRHGHNSATGVVGVIGWALDGSGVARVDIYVQKVPSQAEPSPQRRPVGRAFYGLLRPGVTARFPGFVDSSGPGFGAWVNTTEFFNGQYLLFALVTSVDGSQRWLGPFTFEIMNLTHNLVPFGEIERPLPHATLFGVCDLDDPFRRHTVVKGFALDVGVENGDLGVGYVELLIDGAIFWNTKVDCVRDPAQGGLTNCYGLRRTDVEREFPGIPDGPTSGFRFVLDVGQLLNMGYRPGRHVLTIRSGDIAGQVANIAEVPVNFFCGDDGDQPSFGFIDEPSPVHIQSGLMTVKGWVLDFEGVNIVQVFVDGLLAGQASHGISRPGVAAAFPGFPDSAAAGFTFQYDTTLGPDGVIKVLVQATDVNGNVTIIGQRTVVVDNSIAN